MVEFATTRELDFSGAGQTVKTAQRHPGPDMAKYFAFSAS